MRIRLLSCVAIALFVISPAKAGIVSGLVTGTLFQACNGGSSADLYDSGLMASAAGSIGSGCQALGISFASAEAMAGAGGISGSASAINGLARISAGYTDTVFLVAPSGPSQDVLVKIRDTYSLSISDPDALNAAFASVGFSAPGVEGFAYLDNQEGDPVVGLVETGVFAGEFTMRNCSATSDLCSFIVSWGGDARAAATSSASFSDPLSIDLPPGWTFNLASQQVAAVPEPNYLSELSFALGVLGLTHSLRRHLGRRSCSSGRRRFFCTFSTTARRKAESFLRV